MNLAGGDGGFAVFNAVVLELAEVLFAD